MQMTHVKREIQWYNYEGCPVIPLASMPYHLHWLSHTARPGQASFKHSCFDRYNRYCDGLCYYLHTPHPPQPLKDRKWNRQAVWNCVSLLETNLFLTHTLTPWCRILFENLIVTLLVKKYLAFLRNPKVHHRVHKSPPLDPILSQPNAVRPIDPCLPKVHFNVILPPTSRSSKWSLAFGHASISSWHIRDYFQSTLW
jgi:hypothetical protein